MSQAVSGSMKEQPLAFASTVAAGGASQFVHFQTLDDQCPNDCGSTWLLEQRPQLTPILHESRQLSGELPKQEIRAVQTPIAVLGLVLLPILFAWALRRRDPTAASLVAVISVCLVANAALGGGLSDVHDRYQSRAVWLAPFAALLLIIRARQRGQEQR